MIELVVMIKMMIGQVVQIIMIGQVVQAIIIGQEIMIIIIKMITIKGKRKVTVINVEKKGIWLKIALILKIMISLEDLKNVSIAETKDICLGNVHSLESQEKMVEVLKNALIAEKKGI